LYFDLFFVFLQKKIMFKFVIEMLLIFLIVVGILTQIIVPLFVPSLRFFWIFYPDRVENKTVDEAIDNLANELSENKMKMKESLEKVDDTIEKLNQVKNK
jgi:hypothetical protein